MTICEEAPGALLARLHRIAGRAQALGDVAAMLERDQQRYRQLLVDFSRSSGDRAQAAADFLHGVGALRQELLARLGDMRDEALQEADLIQREVGAA